MKKKLNIGCGYDKFPGFINIDKSPIVQPDKVVNIEDGLPFEDNSFSYIFSCHCLEHIRPQFWQSSLGEIRRVAKPNCTLELILPFDNVQTRTNADHYRGFSWLSFEQFSPKSKRCYQNKLTMERISKIPHKPLRTLAYLFPSFVKEVHLKYRIIKD